LWENKEMEAKEIRAMWRAHTMGGDQSLQTNIQVPTHAKIFTPAKLLSGVINDG
jgi:hypothetical protein